MPGVTLGDRLPARSAAQHILKTQPTGSQRVEQAFAQRFVRDARVVQIAMHLPQGLSRAFVPDPAERLDWTPGAFQEVFFDMRRWPGSGTAVPRKPHAARR